MQGAISGLQKTAGIPTDHVTLYWGLPTIQYRLRYSQFIFRLANHTRGDTKQLEALFHTQLTILQSPVWNCIAVYRNVKGTGCLGIMGNWIKQCCTRQAPNGILHKSRCHQINMCQRWNIHWTHRPVYPDIMQSSKDCIKYITTKTGVKQWSNLQKFENSQNIPIYALHIKGLAYMLRKSIPLQKIFCDSITISTTTRFSLTILVM